MKYVKQFLLILFICFLGELLRFFIPLPIPASIYGLLIMLTALLTGIVKVEQVDETAAFLIEIMPVMFIPAGAGLLASYSSLKPHLIEIVIITLTTTVLVMGITGRIAQTVMKHKYKEQTAGTPKDGGSL